MLNECFTCHKISDTQMYCYSQIQRHITDEQEATYCGGRENR